MRPGTVLVDLAAAGGGNCELTKPGETQVFNGVTLLAPLNLATAVPGHASQLYSRNISNFLTLIVKDGRSSSNMGGRDSARLLRCPSVQGRQSARGFGTGSSDGQSKSFVIHPRGL